MSAASGGSLRPIEAASLACAAGFLLGGLLFYHGPLWTRLVLMFAGSYGVWGLARAMKHTWATRTSPPWHLLIFGVAQSLLCSVIAFLRLGTEHPDFPVVMTISGGFLLVAASPMMVRRVLQPLECIVQPIGFRLLNGVGHLSLVLTFYLAVVPTGLLMRALGKDPLDRQIDRSAPTYWKEREVSPLPPGSTERDRYKRQF